MPDSVPDLVDFARRLVAAGVEQRCADRLAAELKDHLDDRVADLRADGFDDLAAKRMAAADLGSLDAIANLACSHRALLSFPGRYPLVAAAAVAATDGAGTLARWSLIMVSSAAITAGTLLAMQLAITLS